MHILMEQEFLQPSVIKFCGDWFLIVFKCLKLLFQFTRFFWTAGFEVFTVLTMKSTLVRQWHLRHKLSIQYHMWCQFHVINIKITHISPLMIQCFSWMADFGYYECEQNMQSVVEWLTAKSISLPHVSVNVRHSDISFMSSFAVLNSRSKIYGWTLGFLHMYVKKRIV